MELEEELAEEDAECIVVRNQTHADSLDNTEDMIMHSEDEEISMPEKTFELSTSEEDAQPVKANVVSKKRLQVSFFSAVAEITNTDVPP